VASPRQAGLNRAYGQLRNVLFVVGGIVLIWAVVVAAIWTFTGSNEEVPPAVVTDTTAPQSPGIFAGTTTPQQPGISNPAYTTPSQP
jgi:hypothetical protein